VHSALFAWRRARAAGGRFLLRIEDIDPARCRPAFADAIIEDLRWLGLNWDGPVRVQSAHLAEYRGVLDVLAEHGLLYPCFCTRADIARELACSVAAPHGAEGPAYPGTCRALPTSAAAARVLAGEPHALRLHMARALAAAPALLVCEEGKGMIPCDPAPFGDVVLARKDAPASYHLCATHDDAIQGVTLVTRGVDLRPAMHLHRLLQALLDWPVPTYAHHGLLTAPDGRRLAKRDGAASLRQMRAGGMSPAEVRALAGFPD